MLTILALRAGQEGLLDLLLFKGLNKGQYIDAYMY